MQHNGDIHHSHKGTCGELRTEAQMGWISHMGHEPRETVVETESR